MKLTRAEILKTVLGQLKQEGTELSEAALLQVGAAISELRTQADVDAYIRSGSALQLSTELDADLLAQQAVIDFGLFVWYNNARPAYADAADVRDTLIKAFATQLSENTGVQDRCVQHLQKQLTDSGIVTDSILIRLAQALADVAQVTDQLTYTLSTSRSDAFSVSDTQSVGVSKPITDQSTLTDTTVRVVNKLAVDVTAANDQLLMGVDKALNESVYIYDAVTFNYALSTGDTLTVTVDEFVVGRAFPFGTVGSVNDEHHLYLQRVLNETSTVTDTLQFSLATQVSDTASVVDSPLYALTKPVSNTTAVTDTSVYHISKSFSDAITVSDLLNADRYTQQDVTLTFGATDQLAWELGRQIEESTALTDAVYMEWIYVRSATDTSTVAERFTQHLYKQISDNINVTESLVNDGAYRSSQALTATLTEQALFDINAVRNDVTHVNETYTYALQRALNHTASLNSQLALHTFKVFGDHVSISEQLVDSSGTEVSEEENAMLSDSGYLVHQNYADSYFAGDYVGDIRTF